MEPGLIDFRIKPVSHYVLRTRIELGLWIADQNLAIQDKAALSWLAKFWYAIHPNPIRVRNT